MRILADLAYHGYAVLIAHMECEPYLHALPEGKARLQVFYKPNLRFAGLCRAFRRRIEAYDSVKGGGIPKTLYNPAGFVTFGDCDNVAVVAVDDFQVVEDLTSHWDLPVRQTSVAFCPKLASLGLDRSPNSPFCEMDDVCDGPHPREDSENVAHPFIEQRPLTAVTYYRLSGMAVLGPGLLFQQAVYKAMARRIKEVLQTLATECSAGTYGGSILEADIRSFKCMFLDPQGWSDIATIMFCKNYSVIATVIQCLRALTLRDLYATDRDCEDAVDLFGIHRLVAEIENIERKKARDSRVSALLQDNHVFCSTFTTLGMSHDAFDCPDRAEADHKYHGVVSADAHFVVSPGHAMSVRDFASEEANAKPAGSAVWEGNGDCEWALVGLHDYTYEAAVESESACLPKAYLFDVVQQNKRLRGCKEPDKPRGRVEWSIQDLHTAIHIPCPILKDFCAPESGGPNGHVNLRPILRDLAERVFDLPEGPLNIENLRKNIEFLRLPSPVSGALVYLYADFAKCISDVYLFDHVLDLYDVFLAVYRLFCKELPAALNRALEEARDDPDSQQSACLSFLSWYEIREIKDLLDLMESALKHRMQMGFKEVERWDTAVDFKGGRLNRLVSAADAPLKCALGVLKRVRLGATTVYKPSEGRDLGVARDGIEGEIRSRIGGASRVSSSVRAESRRFDLGNEGFLTGLSLSVAHLVRPNAFVAHFHEVGHLLCDLILSEDKCSRNANCSQECWRASLKETKPVEEDIARREKRERYEEIFSEMLLHRFIFEYDTDTYLRNYVITYFLDPISLCKQSNNTLVRMVEVLIRGFLITDPFRGVKKVGSGEDLYATCEAVQLDRADEEESVRRFRTTIEGVGPLFCEFRRLWSEDQVQDYAIRQFRKVYGDIYKPLCCMWDDVKKVHSGICTGPNFQWSTDPPAEEIKDILTAVEQGYKEGRPVVRVLYRDSRPCRAEIPEENGVLDPGFVIRHLLRIHIERLYGKAVLDPKKWILLPRNPRSGERIAPDDTDKSRQYNRQLVDRNMNGVLWTDLEGRTEYMRSRVMVIKTLWDISTNLRARRLKELLCTAWPPAAPVSD